MNVWRLRFFLIGGINAAIGVILLIVRGFSIPFMSLIAVGIVILMIGFIWKSKVKTEDLHVH